MPEMQGLEPGDSRAKCQKSKDENSVNREIATLLLNLASRTQAGPGADSADHFKSEMETEAMDLSKYSVRSRSDPAPAPTAHYSPPAPAPYIPSLPLPQPQAALNPSLAANLGSSYLLQNLLIGQIQTLTSSQSGSQQLATAHSGLMQSCQKSPTTLTESSGQAPALMASESSKSYNSTNNSLTSPLPSLANLGSSTIPLLSGHIVAQLNSLLFSVHGLDDQSLELSVQTQLAAIYTRLQEVVAMVSLAKKKDVKVKTEQPLVTSSTSSKDQGRQAEAAASLSVSSVTDEQKITKQLEEYQRALYKSSQKSEIGQYNPGQSMAAKLLESQTQNSPEQPLKVDVASRKSCEDSGCSESPRGEVSSVLENLRRRASRDGFSVVESPPEKRSRRAAVAQGVPVTPATSPQPTSSGSGRSKSSGKGGKGIRNRVFCGDCPGCLKNDDCGQCRYCRDKTKFGGQNRLRQKCLLRRCQMDTHRRSNGGSGSQQQAGAGASDLVSTTGSHPAAPPVYSGLDLARYRGHPGTGGGNDADSGPGGGGGGETDTRPAITAEHSIFTTLLGAATPGLLHSVHRAERTGSADDRDSAGSGSRSDKWKAKHEAMLDKLANRPRTPVSPPQLSIAENLSSRDEKNMSGDVPGHVFENKNLVITIKDALKENNENQAIQSSDGEDEELELKSDRSQNKSKHSDRSNMNMKSSDSKKDVNRLTTRSMKPVFAL